MSFAVVLPVRNGADYLAAALDSILAQDMPDFTLHVSDNASTDATPAILADYAARDPRVRVSRSEEPLSQVANMNRAVALADSEWVQMFCHDDLMRGDCLRQVTAAIAAVEGTNVALIGHAQRHLFADGVMTPEQPDGPLAIDSGPAQLRKRFRSEPGQPLSWPAVTTAAVRRDAFAAQGGFEEGYLHFDLFRWLEMLVEYDYAFIPAQLTVNRIHPAQVAIAGHRSLRTALETRQFFPGFVARHAKALGLGWRAFVTAYGFAPSLAARELVSRLRTGRLRDALRVFALAPAVWWPLLPLLALRSWRKDLASQRSVPGLSTAAYYGYG